MNARNDGIVNIHGKEYQTVALRVATFRSERPNHSLTTEIVYRDENCVVMKATISYCGEVLATGHSEEYRTSSSINKTSALENSETSAIGRALAALGYGGTEFATADEVANAINNKQPAQKLSSKSVAAVEFESLPPEEQEFLQGIAMDVIALLDEGRDWQAKQLLESKNLDNDEKVAIWHLFNSKQRSSIKKAVSPEELATTP